MLFTFEQLKGENRVATILFLTIFFLCLIDRSKLLFFFSFCVLYTNQLFTSVSLNSGGYLLF